ncbi:hypothetical protein GLE_2288 [Lysobacter enzymogenes]|uniref:Uncharacterized protein n=1 Tax=Lysobacter enzymogenes TaxID=69 RepID=A0A0S2DG89_LYSEN|nr:DUF5691 domain-containing protein [Lysobacter enzymogenes]ALN57637.1 hypothetical protein GLE_2288 [Lysobacter enzymogenes]
MSANLADAGGDWIKPALVGIDGARAPAFPAPVGELLEQVDGDDALARYARGAAAMAACRLAAVEVAPAAAEPPPAAPDDARMIGEGEPLAPALAAIFRGDSERLHHEACQRLAALGRALPAAALASALDAGRQRARLRPALLPVLGERGLWLARLNPDWRYADRGAAGAGENVVGEGAAGEGEPADSAAEVARLWQEGSFEQRLALFARVRAAEPTRAREMLQAQLGELPAKERAAFVAEFDAGLGADDEALLAGLLKDRGREVRRLAASLLARLPQSAHAQRLAAWLAPLVTQERVLLVKRWTLDAPQAADPEWAAAAIDAARPQNDALGERAWWLYQLARQMPLRWWCERTGMDPAALLAWAGKSDWKQALYRGWIERIHRDDGDWVQAMLDAPGRAFGEHHGELLALLPPAQRVRHWPRSFAELCRSGRLDEVLGSCAPGQWLPLDYSRLVGEGLQQAGDTLRQDWSLRQNAQTLLEALHPQALHGWQAPPRAPDDTPALADCLAGLERTAQLRRLLHA